MRILAVINISNVDDFFCDSGVIFQRILAEEFVRKKIEYGIVGPGIQAFKNFKLPGAKKYYIALGTTRYSSRFSFDWTGLSSVIRQYSPDLIFNNQIEITSAIRSVLVTLKSPQMPIVSYCHYPALWGILDKIPELDESLNHQKLGLPILFDILSALLTSNVVVIQSEFAKTLLTKAAHYFRLGEFRDMEVVPPPKDPLLTGNCPSRVPQRRQLFYNHRLYQSYGSEQFIQFIRQISDSDFELVVSDPMSNRSSSRSQLSNSPAYYRKQISLMPRTRLINGNRSRDHYKKAIQNSRVAFGAFRKACVWSMAAVDCMGLGTPVIAPRYAAYPEFIPDSLLFDNLKEAEELTKRLLYDDSFWIENSQKCVERTFRLSPQIIAERLVQLFEKQLSSLQFASV